MYILENIEVRFKVVLTGMIFVCQKEVHDWGKVGPGERGEPVEASE